MFGKRMIYLIVVAVLAAMGFIWKTTSRSAYESAKYNVVRSDGPFEIREYPELMMATTNMDFPRKNGNDGSFSRLFGYITGANADNQKVAMTTPVFMESADGETSGQMGFVIPQRISQEHRIPEPVRGDVQIRSRAGGQFATLRFAGRIERDAEAAEKKLRTWIEQTGLRIESEVEVAGYDPPWTPGPLRRNEVLLRLKSP